MTPSIHASAVLVGERGVLIRGPSGSGKSRLAFDLILAARAGQIPATTLIGDDRVCLTAHNGRLTVQGVPELAGMIEIRGLGIRTIGFTDQAPVDLIVDLSATDADRLPAPEALKTLVFGLEIARIPVALGYDALPLVLAFLTTV
jgi:serine kinase of HPr protein (carbohydrate metabolism regulator)